jgi:alanyl-tRNA synthetase
LRTTFLDYFAQHDHVQVPSASLVPQGDPSLLFTNAGMVPFKEVFLGTEQRPYLKAVSCQKCLRAGGKHNDLDNVGYTARHHTFFEMLGNFSFGAYFKREAIAMAWELLTDVLGLSPQRLWVTVFRDDDEAETIWHREVGLSKERIARLDEADNFWAMGEHGPCGPCSEIYYDHGPELAGEPPGHGDCGDRYVEIWNLVFIQYDRLANGSLLPLPRPCIDTGMGLERIAAVMQGVHDNFDTDIFLALRRAVADLGVSSMISTPSCKVIADHIRACGFLLADGVMPSNEGRGYVLRRIIRRAVRHGAKLGLPSPFLHQLIDPLITCMGEAYPELLSCREQAQAALLREESRFTETLHTGLALLERAIDQMGAARCLPGNVAFQLADTYGFPLDLTADICRERGIEVDEAGFQREMDQQRARSRGVKDSVQATDLPVPDIQASAFVGYESLETQAHVVALLQDDLAVSWLPQGATGAVALDRTPFYPQGGGQLGDTGQLILDGGCFAVHDTQVRQGVIWHMGRMESGLLRLNGEVRAMVDVGRRKAIRRNHTATHLLHAALRTLFGSGATQQGSLVAPERLRFDVALDGPIDHEQRKRLERMVNEHVWADRPVTTQEMPYQEAIAHGAVALFGERYGDKVRVLSVDGCSVELCGGTHVDRTGEIGLFKIIEESGIQTGVRRIEAVTGEAALEWVQQAEETLEESARLLSSAWTDVPTRLQEWSQRLRTLQEEQARVAKETLRLKQESLASQAMEVGSVRVMVGHLGHVEAKLLRQAAEQLRHRYPESVVVVGGEQDGKGAWVVAVSAHVAAHLSAQAINEMLIGLVSGRGGGRSDWAQGGTADGRSLPDALTTLRDILAQRLAGLS